MAEVSDFRESVMSTVAGGGAPKVSKDKKLRNVKILDADSEETSSVQPSILNFRKSDFYDPHQSPPCNSSIMK